MEHACMNCGHQMFNNAKAPDICPKCGHQEFTSHWDEGETSELSFDIVYGDLEGDEETWEK